MQAYIFLVLDIDREEILRIREKSTHFAAISNDPGYGSSKEIGTAVNYDASVRLYDSCVRCGVKRFIFPSSCSVYGHIEASCRELDERAELHPLTLYSRTKADFERYISAHPSYMDCVVLRPATVYGFSYRQRFDLLFNRLIISAYYGVSTETPHINNVRPALFLPDLIKIYLMFIESPQKIGGVYNVAGENLTVGETCSIISREIGKKVKIEHSHNYPNTERSYSVLSATLCKIFGGFRFTSMAEGTKGFMRIISRKIFDDYRENDAYYNAKKQPLYFS